MNLNHRYAAKDGILYTRDMRTLVAVPILYDQLIDVPEGVSSWLPEAILEYSSWDTHLKKCPGVSLPSTLVDIAQSQLTRLNRVAAASSTFKITVHADNPVYYVDGKGLLQERPNVYGAKITLDCDTFTYDGTQKCPVPTVTLPDGAVLTEGTDYTVTYLNNVDAGTGVVRIEGMADYPGAAEATFTIQPRSIAGASLKLLAQLIWNGEYQSQPYAAELPVGATYAVLGDTAREVGVYQLTVQGTGNYTGSISCLYEIAPDAALLDSLNADNVTPANLQALMEIRAMMANANTALADASTRAHYAQITDKCEALIALLSWQLPETGDNFSHHLWWGAILVCGALLYLLVRKKGRTV